VVGIAIGTVLLPDLARKLRSGDELGGRDSFNRSIEFALALTLPAAIALVVIALPLTPVLYQRGAFGPADTQAVALALAIYGAGLPAFVLQKIWQPLFYAREDSRRPFLYAVLAMVVNAVLAIGLMPILGFAAAAIATTAAAWIMLGQLIWGARDMGIAVEFDARALRRIPRIIAAGVLMGAGLFVMTLVLIPALTDPIWRYGALALLIAVGAVIYFGSGTLLGGFKPSHFRRQR
jgi:putative peptidoglycan lipid II flippase